MRWKTEATNIILKVSSYFLYAPNKSCTISKVFLYKKSHMSATQDREDMKGPPTTHTIYVVLCLGGSTSTFLVPTSILIWKWPTNKHPKNVVTCWKLDKKI